MKKITQILFTLLLSCVATNAFATDDLEDGAWYTIKSDYKGTYLNFSNLPQENSTAEELQLIKQASGKWYIKNAAGKYLNCSTWNAAASTTPVAWTINGTSADGYYISTKDGEITYPGYFGPQDGKTKFYTNNKANTTCKFIFTLTKHADVKYVITYVLDGVDASKWKQETKVDKDAAYPTPSISNPFITLDESTFPTGKVTKDDTVTLGYTNTYECFADVANVTQWYALDIHGNEGDYPVYAKAGMDTVYAYKNTAKEYQYRRVAKGTADDYQGGSVMSDYFAWAFIGNPFDGVKLYNKGLGQYVYFNGVPSDVSDRKKAPATFVSAVGDASVFTPIANTYVENGFSLESKNAGNPKKILNQKDHIVSGYGSADGGSAMRAWPINYTTGIVNRTLAAEYGTIIVPFYAAIPDGITVYSCDSVAGNVLGLVEQTAIYPNVPYIIKGTAGTEYTFTCPTTGSYTAPASKGLLTGVYETTELQSLAQAAGEDNTAYVLALQNSRVAFCSLEDKAYTETLPANYCYLTLKNEAGGEVKSTLFFDEETAIESIQNFEQAKPLNNSSEFIIQNNGKFLENGKIVIVKNNAKYNVAGQMIK